MNINQKRLVINANNGKISLAKSALSCPKCLHYAEQNAQLRKSVYHLNQLLILERRKNQQMDTLCIEIEKTKQKLYKKLLSRKQQLDSVIISENSPLQTYIPSLATRRGSVLFNPKSSTRLKELSTDRTMNNYADRRPFDD